MSIQSEYKKTAFSRKTIFQNELWFVGLEQEHGASYQPELVAVRALISPSKLKIDSLKGMVERVLNPIVPNLIKYCVALAERLTPRYPFYGLAPRSGEPLSLAPTNNSGQ